MAEFESALHRTLEHEGGYSNNPNDPGGETYCGISRNAWPDWQGWELIDKEQTDSPEMSLHVSNFYFDLFWKPLRCYELDRQEIASYLFDFAVNSGHVSAVRALQHALNSCGARLVVDGKIGSATIAAANSTALSLTEFRVQRVLHYIQTIQDRPASYMFARGWIRRALA